MNESSSMNPAQSSPLAAPFHPGGKLPFVILHPQGCLAFWLYIHMYACILIISGQLLMNIQIQALGVLWMIQMFVAQWIDPNIAVSPKDMHLHGSPWRPPQPVRDNEGQVTNPTNFRSWPKRGLAIRVGEPCLFFSSDFSLCIFLSIGFHRLRVKRAEFGRPSVLQRQLLPLAPMA